MYFPNAGTVIADYLNTKSPNRSKWAMNKILIIDDDLAIRTLYSEELADEGYNVVTTADVSQVMALIEDERPDLIVMDIRLGQCNGLDLLQDIRNTYYQLPVILCTAYSPFKYDLRSVAADYYVIKNASLSELKSRISMALDSEFESLSVMTC
jgi:DNA-binding response OmpR family regulator